MCWWHRVKASKRRSFPKRQCLVNKPDYEWFTRLQVKHKSLADFWLNSLFFSPSNVMALKMTCGNNHWHKLCSKLWPGFPGRKNWHRLKLSYTRKYANKHNGAVLTVWACGMALLLFMSREDCAEFVATKKANENYRMKAYMKDRPTQQIHSR